MLASPTSSLSVPHAGCNVKLCRNHAHIRGHVHTPKRIESDVCIRTGSLFSSHRFLNSPFPEILPPTHFSYILKVMVIPVAAGCHTQENGRPFILRQKPALDVLGLHTTCGNALVYTQLINSASIYTAISSTCSRLCPSIGSSQIHDRSCLTKVAI